MMDPEIIPYMTYENIIVAPFSNITCSTVLGCNVVINAHTTVGHDITIGDHTVVSTNVTIGGNSVIGKESFVGLGAQTKENLSVGSEVIIGMGSIVFKDIPDKMIAMGNPARPLRRNENKKVFTKSGIMVGLGEKHDEIIQVMDDLRSANVDFITIGQYLQPSVKHHPLERYYHPDEFKELEIIAKSKGFLLVSSSPLTRSSYHADEDFAKLKQNRINSH